MILFSVTFCLVDLFLKMIDLVKMLPVKSIGLQFCDMDTSNPIILVGTRIFSPQYSIYFVK